MAALLSAPAVVAAQGTATSSGQYPSKPVRIIIPFPPGAATDLTGRYVAQKLGEALGQQVVADNRPGANGTIGLELAAKAPPDGHTLVIGQTGNLAISPGLTRVGYDPVRDFAPISLLIASPHVLAAHPSLPVRSLKELVSFARARPGQLNYASTGSGSAGHLGMELLRKATRMDLVHVPYKGGAPATTATVAGEVAAMFAGTSTAPQIKAGKLRALAVTGARRSDVFTDLPTIGEFYPGYEMTIWLGLFAPAGTPEPVLGRLREEIGKALASPDVTEKLGRAGGLQPFVTSAPEFAALIRRDYDKYGKLVREIGVRAD
jgi:tripartite-type tricarboxylate transporter receptor subunit TctC